MVSPISLFVWLLVTGGYFSDLASEHIEIASYMQACGLLGGHSGIGPPSGAGTLGTAA